MSGSPAAVTPSTGAALSGHVGHLLAVAVPLAVLLTVAIVDEAAGRLRGRRSPPRRLRASARARVLAAVAAVATALAAVVHLLVAPQHFREALAYGVFFVAAGTAQLGFALLLVRRPGPRLAALGALGSAAVIALWALTRTVGIPVGPQAGEREGVGVPDAVASLAELVALVACVLVRRAILRYRSGGDQIDDDVVAVRAPRAVERAATGDQP